MILFLTKLIVVYILVMGVMILTTPQLLKSFIDFWMKGNRIYWGGVLRLLFGAIFLFAAPACRWSGLIITFGILFLAGGVLIFALGAEKMKTWIHWWENRSDAACRVLAVVTIAVGILLLYAI